MFVDFSHRVPQEELENRGFYRTLGDPEDCQAFFEFTGTRFTVLDRLGDWHAAKHSPPDAMHLIHLGAINWIAKQVLFAPGMFTKRRGAPHNPLEVLNKAIGRVWVPYCITRLPPKVFSTWMRPHFADISPFSLDKQQSASKLINGRSLFGYLRR